MVNSILKSLRNKFPAFIDLKITDDYPFIKEIESKSLEEAYNLISLLNGTNIQIATSESLTAGLIMSTLVRIPLGGWHKYGCFGVYDTDAKRVFNSVEVDNVYTHTCAKEMAIGILKNSNATLAISVTGNAVPYHTDVNKLGEVFIGIAGYRKNAEGSVEIIYTTKSINACLESSESSSFLHNCKKWINSQTPTTLAPINESTYVSFMIRNFTVYQALKECKEFFIKNKHILISPNFIKIQKDNNNIISDICYHKQIPAPKYPDVESLKIICISSSETQSKSKSKSKSTNDNESKCQSSKTCERVNTKEINIDNININNINNLMSKKSRKKSKSKRKKTKKTLHRYPYTYK